MIAVTGASGFIGSRITTLLRDQGHYVLTSDIVGNTNHNPESLLTAIDDNQISAVVHMGACTDTLCSDLNLLNEMNTEYTKRMFRRCARYDIPLIYASSAATYGDGNNGFSDAHDNTSKLNPLNPYGNSKHLVDLWALEQAQAGMAPQKWAALKFFNVYGQSEWNKNKMASMVFQAMRQAVEHKKIRLFKDGEQRRDWVYVDDVYNVIKYMLNHPCCGIYNVGSGEDRSFNEVAAAAFSAVGISPTIEYFDMPESIRGAYQSYSKAEIGKLRDIGFTMPMTRLEEGTQQIANYWEDGRYA